MLRRPRPPLRGVRLRRAPPRPLRARSGRRRRLRGRPRAWPRRAARDRPPRQLGADGRRARRPRLRGPRRRCPPTPRPLHRWLARRRAALGVTVHPPGGGARAIVDRLRRGEAAAIFIDQATRERGRPIGFFGRPAPTPTTFARLLALTGATPLWLWSVRGADGRHHIRVEPLPGDDPLGAATARLEAAVRAQPAQWVWLHDRWRDAAG
ncbi:MAG: lysophospholipid acyltransferase family protein [Myxococcales bacterium]|nr:lysophospholipid acyltransferase family protein [Myxococcales bacterium]